MGQNDIYNGQPPLIVTTNEMNLTELLHVTGKMRVTRSF